MSWSIRAEGPKDESLKAIRSQADGITYKPWTPEGDDAVAAVSRIEALAAVLVPSDKVVLSAYGSHSSASAGAEITSASLTVDVRTVS